MADGLAVFFGLLLAYLVVLVLLVRTGWLQKLNMSLFLGVFLMIKTTRGQSLLNWLARARRSFDRVAHGGLYLTGFVMAAMTLLLVLQLIIILRLDIRQAPPPSYVLGIPGINPLIPVGFGIAALVFTVIVHELSHGVMARVYGLKVKTMGLLLFIVPVGAFVEPDEEALKAAPRKQRLKVFGAGPTSNLLFTLVFGFIFSSVLMAGVSPVAGVPVERIEEGGPAEAAGLQPGWLITHLDGGALACPEDFSARMGNLTTDVRPNTTVTLQVDPRDGGPPRQVSLVTERRADLYNGSEYQEFYARDPEFANQTVIGVSIFPSCQLATMLAHPFSSLRGFLTYLLLPFEALEGRFPLNAPDNGFFETPFSAPVFWFLANLLYWLFWINLMVGLTNALPLMPLDGGHMFRDFMDGLLARVRPGLSPEARSLAATRWTAVVGFSVFALILLQFVGPGLLGLLS